MIPSQSAAAASTTSGDYWMISRTGAYDNMLVSAGATGPHVKTGGYFEKFTAGGSRISTKVQNNQSGTPYSFYQSKTGKDGYLYALQYSYSSNAFLLAKMVADTGQIIWQKEIAKPTSGTGPYGYGWHPIGPLGFSDVDADASGNVYLTVSLAEFNQNGITTIQGSLVQQVNHAILLKLNSSGVQQWSKLISSNSLGTGWSCQPTSITVDSAGYPILTVYYDPPAYSGWNTGILRFDTNGNLQWQKKILGPQSTASYRMYGSYNVGSGLNLFFGAAPTQNSVGYPVAPFSVVLDNSGNLVLQKMYTLASGKTFGYYIPGYVQETVSGNKVSFLYNGYASSNPSAEVWYLEIDYSNSTTANTVGAQMKISDSAASGVYVGSQSIGAKKYYDSSKNKNYLYTVLNTGGTKIFKLSTDSSFLAKNTIFRSPGTTTTCSISTSGDIFSAVADSTFSTLISIGAGLLNIYAGPGIIVQAPTATSISSTSGYVDSATSATYRIGKRS